MRDRAAEANSGGFAGASVNGRRGRPLKKVLILGAGLVSRPIVDYLLHHDDYEVTVASRTVSKAQALIAGHARGRALAFDITKTPEKLKDLVADCDVAVSLLPYIYHLDVARQCIDLKKHMVTTSYVKPEMRALDGEARDAGILILNELGLDPGIDHMSAQKIIDEVHAKGGKIDAFRSFCGGLPAADCNDNPWGYKFSWSPRGVVMAGSNDARFLEDGEIVEIPGGEQLFASAFPFPVAGVDYIGYPNRDSTPYVELYGIPETKTMQRGTLRYPGWCETWEQIFRLDLVDQTERPHLEGRSYAALVREITAVEGDDLKKALADKLAIPSDHVALKNLEYIGFLGEDPLPEGTTSGFEALIHRLDEKLVYGKSEKDLIVLVHRFEASFPDGGRKKIMSVMIDEGIPEGDSAMSRTVSLPAAIGVKMILEGAIQDRGVRIPIAPGIYEPVLAELESMDIVCKESYEDL